MWLQSYSLVSAILKMMVWNSAGETRPEAVCTIQKNITGFCASELLLSAARYRRFTSAPRPPRAALTSFKKRTYIRDNTVSEKLASSGPILFFVTSFIACDLYRSLQCTQIVRFPATTVPHKVAVMMWLPRPPIRPPQPVE